MVHELRVVLQLPRVWSTPSSHAGQPAGRNTEQLRTQRPLSWQTPHRVRVQHCTGSPSRHSPTLPSLHRAQAQPLTSVWMVHRVHGRSTDRGTLAQTPGSTGFTQVDILKLFAAASAQHTKSTARKTHLLTDPIVAIAPGENLRTSPLVILTST